MTVGVVSSGLIEVEALKVIGKPFAILVSYFADDPSQEDEEPVDDTTSDETSTPTVEQNPPDLGINVEDESKAGEHFGP